MADAELTAKIIGAFEVECEVLENEVRNSG